MNKGRGYGKVILINEHFSVHKIPAIVSGIGDYTDAEICSPEKSGDNCPVKSGSGLVFTDHREATADYKDNKYNAHIKSINLMLKEMGLDLSQDICIRLSGTLYAASGVGASAASCAAITRALGKHFDIELINERVNEIAYEGEKAFHGTPSGIDNSAATYGGLLWFQKTDSKPILEEIKIEKPFEIVMGNTGIVADTTAAVDGVKERKKQDPEKYDKIFEEARELAGEARKAIEAYDLKRLGELMNKNHELLQSIEVSHDLLEKLVDIARSEGAYGAKLTGGGLGGYMVALTPGKELQDKVANAIEAEGYTVVKTVVK
jgi:mevalonate kinase